MRTLVQSPDLHILFAGLRPVSIALSVCGTDRPEACEYGARRWTFAPCMRPINAVRHVILVEKPSCNLLKCPWPCNNNALRNYLRRLCCYIPHGISEYLLYRSATNVTSLRDSVLKCVRSCKSLDLYKLFAGLRPGDIALSCCGTDRPEACEYGGTKVDLRAMRY
jgi:hypothetical protein